MKMLLSAALTSIIALSGCATQIMEGYIGQSVQEPILDYGPPFNVVELGEDRVAFQWKIESSGIMPMSTPTTSTVFGSNGGFATVNTTTMNLVPYSQECLYTLTTTKQGNDFIVDGYRQPRLGCL